MHELSLARDIIEIIRDDQIKMGLTKVDTVTLKIGHMTQVIPERLRFGFECLSEETSLEGAELVIESVPSSGRCMTCGKDFRINHWTFVCPVCSSTDISILSGREFEISEYGGH
jgi:hydrogenase nickel incorporation protein HypA/HybF